MAPALAHIHGQRHVGALRSLTSPAMKALLLLSALACAAAPVDAQTVYRLATGSSGHTLELSLDGETAGRLAVAVVEAPAWLVFEAPRAEALPAETSGEPVAVLRFNVAVAAPLAVPADVRLQVLDAAGAVRAEHTMRVEAGPPAVLALAAPRPNPSVGATVLAWTLPQPAEARVSVFDALGREVAVLAEGTAEAGGYEGRLAAGQLAAGAYVVRLVAGREVRTQRLTVVR